MHNAASILLSVGFIHLFWLFTVPGSDLSLTSDAALPPAVDRPVCHLGAASSPAAAAAARSTASAGAGAGEGATATPRTGATVGVRPGTQSLAPAVVAGVVVRGTGAAKPGIRFIGQYEWPEPPVMFPAESGEVDVGSIDCVRLCALLRHLSENVPEGGFH